MRVTDFLQKIDGRTSKELRIGLIGFGKTNRAVYGRIDRNEYDITVRCNRPCEIPVGTRAIFGDGYLDGIDEDIIFLSPSVRRDHPSLLDAVGRGVTVTSECEVFFDGVSRDASQVPQVFAVSGSDGKTTVTKMAAEMLDAVAVGNIGLPYSAAEGRERYVAELSSFNLFGFAPPSVSAVITSLSPNHLDWHRDLTEYYAAKSNLLKNTARAVVSADGDALTLARSGDTLFSTSLTRGELLRLGAGHTVTVEHGMICYDDGALLRADELSLTEPHNISNTLAAIGLCHGFCDTEKIREVAMTFTAPHHRCEIVHTSRSGITFINSSIDTTPSRTGTTLAGLNKPVLLLLGGRGKGLPLTPLTDPIKKYARSIAIYGEIGKEMYGFLTNVCDGIPIMRFSGFTDALYHLCDIAKSGDTVLLSPAATAYGEFENYEKRGELFTQLVKERHP
ncbi:MAG: UDP-N-acetylmuramoyl-L-alanine--D-glutamate ligase [Clostridia bacterium]|nr:UDP-N-acetylmuramoyl-L-alanine--D-glutamate ligase [Clostridia bacterium]